MNNSTTILDSEQIQQKITRIAYQLWEDNMNESEVYIAGIVEFGYTIAERLKKELETISGITVNLAKITLDKKSSHLQAQIDIPVDSCSNKVVVVVDDVINSGRTLAYGVAIFFNIPLKKLKTVALVERSHRIFPVTPDYVGMKLATVMEEHVDVILDKADNTKDVVYLH